MKAGFFWRLTQPARPRFAGQLRTVWCRQVSTDRKWSTPLAKTLAEAITTTGPVSLAAFMRQCLTSDLGGYYTAQSPPGRDQFGQKGDFITSPEISQIFGELVGIWMVAEWLAQGKRSSGVELIEVGPGRGTLMDDILRTIRNFKEMASSIEGIYLIEASPSLRDAQKKLLCGEAPMGEVDGGHRSICKYIDAPVIWYEDIRMVPKGNDKAPFIVAHEFFDALPIHAFELVLAEEEKPPVVRPDQPPQAPKFRLQWRELLVSPTPPPSVITDSSSKTPAGDDPDFQLSLARAVTRHSLMLPKTSKRYKDLEAQEGSIIEICPEGQIYAEEFARRIGGGAGIEKGNASGAALILDYGPASTIPTNSLRGIREHRTVSPFSSPGLVDISADVDFVALAEAAINASPLVEVHGPVEQAYFLQTMGIQERAKQLLNNAGTDAEMRKRLESGWKRLVDRGGSGMGKVYKAMAIVPVSDGSRRPVGFGGDITS